MTEHNSLHRQNDDLYRNAGKLPAETHEIAEQYIDRVLSIRAGKVRVNVAKIVNGRIVRPKDERPPAA